MSNITISEAPAENKMGVMPVNRLLFSMSLPCLLYTSDAADEL